MKLGSVNCYLVERNSSFVLIDTGGSNLHRTSAVTEPSMKIIKTKYYPVNCMISG